MPGLVPHVDPEGLLEFSVVYTDRALNHMSQRFQGVMKDIAAILKRSYHAAQRGAGTGQRHVRHGGRGASVRYRQEGTRHPQRLVQLPLDPNLSTWAASPPNPPCSKPGARGLTSAHLGALPNCRGGGHHPRETPDVVFAPHVETSAGMILPDDYLRAVADAVHAVGGLFVLDCIASGALWVNMEATGVDVLVSAPQKGWSGSPCCAMVMLSARARAAIDGTTSSSFACDLQQVAANHGNLRKAADTLTTPRCPPTRSPACAR